MVPNTVIRTAINQACLSVHRFRVGAVVYDGNDILGRGFNQADKTHTNSPHPFKSIHAEFSALCDTGIPCTEFNRYYSRSSIYVHRLLRSGADGLAKPCPWCMELLIKVGFKKKNIHWSWNK